jgi:hypothetical protein
MIAGLERTSVEQVVVLSYNYLEGFKGKRPILPGNIRWISKVPDPTTFTLHAVRFSKDSVVLRKGQSDASKTSFSNVQVSVPPGENIFTSDVDSIRIQSPDTLSIAVVHDPRFAHDAAIVVAALRAIDKKSPDTFHLQQSTTKTYSSRQMDWTIWLSESLPPLPNQNIIYYQRSNSDKLLDQVRNGVWILTKRMNEEIALQENVTVKLALILYSIKKKESKQINSTG